jgi:phenylacetate-CoA ligase
MYFEKQTGWSAFRILQSKEGQYGAYCERKAFKKFAFNDFAKIRAKSLQNLRAVVRYAYNAVPYYRSLWQGIGFDAENLKSEKEVEQLPLLTKEIIEKKKKDLLSENFDFINLETSFTGGSSGTPTSFYRDKRCTTARIGRQLGILELCGYFVGNRSGLI